jgi:hypothetical protein
MAETFKNLASTQLNGGIDDTVTTVTVDSAMGFTGGDFRILIDSEIMKVTGVSGLDLTVARHQEGTSAASHANDAPVYHILTAAGLTDHERNDLVVYDTYANKPAAGVAGRMFLPTDGIFIEHDNGSTWDKFGPIWPMTPPTVADLTPSSTSSTLVDSKGTLVFTTTYSSSLLLRSVDKAYPTPPFTVEVAFLPCFGFGVNSRLGMGLGVKDTAGKIQMYGHAIYSSYTNSVGGENFSAYNSYNSAVTGWAAGSYGFSPQFDSSIIWIKYVDDESHRIISFSADGVSWMQMVSLATNDYLVPDRIGFFMDGNIGNNPYYTNPSMTLLHWKQY